MRRSPNRPAAFRAALRREPVRRLTVGEWSGRFVATTAAVEWSAASSVAVTAEDWQREWPGVVGRLRAGSLDTLKRDASGDVTAGVVVLGGRPVDVVLKRPLEKYWYRRATSVVRAPRARRAWDKARLVRVRGIAVEPPLAVFERRRRGVVVEAVAVFERVPGVTLESADLGATTPYARRIFFNRCGRLLRRLEMTGLAHTDAKSSNWIVFDSPARGPVPVLIDVYGVRWLNPWLGLFGLHRLLRAMKRHAQYTPADSLAICQGFAPHAEFAVEKKGPARAD